MFLDMINEIIRENDSTFLLNVGLRFEGHFANESIVKVKHVFIVHLYGRKCGYEKGLASMQIALNEFFFFFNRIHDFQSIIWVMRLDVQSNHQ